MGRFRAPCDVGAYEFARGAHFCFTARGRCIQHTLRTLTALHTPQRARSAAPTAKSSDLQWESAESTSWGRWKCSTLRPSTRTCWPCPPRRRPAAWPSHTTSWAPAARPRRRNRAIPHCDGPICRRGSPRRLRGGARAPRSVAPVSGAAPLRVVQVTEPGLSPCCTAAGGRRASDSPIHRWRATTSSATWTNWRVCSAVDAGPAPPPAGRGRSGRSTARTRLRALVAGGGAPAGARRARKKRRGGVGGAPDERTSKTGRSEVHGVKSTSCPQVMNCCAAYIVAGFCFLYASAERGTYVYCH